MTMRTILVLGGGGFVGRHVVGRLVSDGWTVVVPTRRRERARHLLPLPTVDVLEADIHDPVALQRLADRARAVINLVGILNEFHPGEFDRVHVDLPRKLIAACQAARVPRLLHMSALNADPKGPSRYLRSKGEAEALMADSGLVWTIFRPSVIFGREDAFLNLFARLERFVPVMALARADARFQPVYVGDVADAFARSIDDDRTHCMRFDLCGPKIYTLRELVSYAGELTGYNRPIVALGPALAKLQASVLERIPGKLMSRDNLASMELDNVCQCDFPALFGSGPTALEAVAPTYLAPDAARDRYADLRAQRGR